MSGDENTSPEKSKDNETYDKVVAWAKAHKVWSTVIAIFLIGAVYNGIAGDPTGSASTDAKSGENSTTDKKQPAKPAATKKAQSPEQKVEKAVRKALGNDVNRDDVKRVQTVEYSDLTEVLDVKFAINDNVTEKLTKASAKLDITDVLKAVQNSGVKVQFMNVEGTFALVDNLGNESEETVVRTSYQGNVVQKINFKNFLHKNVYEIADDVDIHPAFSE